MKRIIISIIVLTSIATACDSTNSKKVKAISTTEKVKERYACPMHLGIMGQEGENCSKCGMKLSVVVMTKDTSTK